MFGRLLSGVSGGTYHPPEFPPDDPPLLPVPPLFALPPLLPRGTVVEPEPPDEPWYCGVGVGAGVGIGAACCCLLYTTDAADD